MLTTHKSNFCYFFEPMQTNYDLRMYTISAYHLSQSQKCVYFFNYQEICNFLLETFTPNTCFLKAVKTNHDFKSIKKGI